MELLEVHQAIQYALSRVEEWNAHAHTVKCQGIEGLDKAGPDHPLAIVPMIQSEEYCHVHAGHMWRGGVVNGSAG